VAPIAPRPPNTGSGGLADESGSAASAVGWLAIAGLLTAGARYSVISRRRQP